MARVLPYIISAIGGLALTLNIYAAEPVKVRGVAEYIKKNGNFEYVKDNDSGKETGIYHIKFEFYDSRQGVCVLSGNPIKIFAKVIKKGNLENEEGLDKLVLTEMSTDDHIFNSIADFSPYDGVIDYYSQVTDKLLEKEEGGRSILVESKLNPHSQELFQRLYDAMINTISTNIEEGAFEKVKKQKW